MELNEEDINFGIIQLDNLTMGSIKPGSLGLVYGDPGTGKSSLLTHFLFKGASLDQNVCLITNEPPIKVAGSMSGFGSYRSKWLKDGYISIFSIRDLVKMIGVDLENAGRDDTELVLDLILQSLDHLDAKRLVIDPITPLLSVLERNSMTSFLQRLKDGLQKMGVTAFLSLDIINDLEILEDDVLDLGMFDILIRFSKEMEQPVTLNTFTIERWRGSPHAKNTYVIDVSKQGIILVPRIKPLEVR